MIFTIVHLVDNFTEQQWWKNEVVKTHKLARGVDSDQDFGYKRETSFLDLGLDFWRKTLILTICRDLELMNLHLGDKI
jgi:hypothetical protein